LFYILYLGLTITAPGLATVLEKRIIPIFWVILSSSHV